MIFRELTAHEFQIFTQNWPNANYYQTVEYSYIMKNQNYESLFLGILINNQVVAATLILIKQLHKLKYAYAPRGFLIDYGNADQLTFFTRQIKKYLSTKKVLAINLNPYLLKTTYEYQLQLKEENPNYKNILNQLKQLGYSHKGDTPYFETMKPRFEAILNLSLDTQALFQNMRKQVRTKIRSAINRGVQIYHGNEEQIPLLYSQVERYYPRNINYFEDCFTYFGKQRKIAIYYAKLDTSIYLKYIQTLYFNQEQIVKIVNYNMIKNASKGMKKLLKQKMQQETLLEYARTHLQKATTLVSEYPSGIILASALVVTCNKEVFLMIDGYDKSYQNINAKYLLIWKLIEKYQQLGYLRLHLGGITDPLIKENPYKGLNEFKLGFGCYIEEYIGDLELICNQPLYFLHKKKKDFVTLKSK